MKLITIVWQQFSFVILVTSSKVSKMIIWSIQYFGVRAPAQRGALQPLVIYFHAKVLQKHKTEYVFLLIFNSFFCFFRFFIRFSKPNKMLKMKILQLLLNPQSLLLARKEKIVLMRNEFWQRNFSIWTKIEEAVTMSLGTFWSLTPCRISELVYDRYRYIGR